MQCDCCLFRGSSIILKYVLNRETNPIKTKFPSFLFFIPSYLFSFLFILFFIYFYLLPFPSLASIHVWLSPLNFFFLSFFLFFFHFLISFLIFSFLYCSGFCHTLKWYSHGFTCVPHPNPLSHLPLHPIPLGLPSAPGPSTCLMHPTWAGDLFHPR